MNLVLYTALAFLPGAIFAVAAKALERWSRGERRSRGVTGAGSQPVGPPIERLVARPAQTRPGLLAHRGVRPSAPRTAVAERDPGVRRHPVRVLHRAGDPGARTTPVRPRPAAGDRGDPGAARSHLVAARARCAPGRARCEETVIWRAPVTSRRHPEDLALFPSRMCAAPLSQAFHLDGGSMKIPRRTGAPRRSSRWAALVGAAALVTSLAACSSGPQGIVVNLYGGASAPKLRRDHRRLQRSRRPAGTPSSATCCPATPTASATSSCAGSPLRTPGWTCSAWTSRGRPSSPRRAGSAS